jgi:hypothetical protein
VVLSIDGLSLSIKVDELDIHEPSLEQQVDEGSKQAVVL